MNFKSIAAKNTAAKDKIEIILFALVIAFIVVNAIVNEEYFVAVLSAIFGLTYTCFAGKGLPVCYFFGLLGSVFYSILAFQNALWGNLALWVLYYIPMQVLGFFSWRKNLKKDKKEIVKTSIGWKKLFPLLLLSCVLIGFGATLMHHFQDPHPILDSSATILSLLGMYLTVRRAIEQWAIWFVVNLLSLSMWLNVYFSGERVLSTVIMWAVYVVLSIYFYICWKRELAKEVSAF